jgi:hypothetical protein
LDETVYREFRPDPRLRPFVECGRLWSGLATPSIRVMPDGCKQVHIFTVADDQITRHRAVRDDLGLLFQLGWQPGGPAR